MDVAYCPECKKAGLRECSSTDYDNPERLCYWELPENQHLAHPYHNQTRWCPRCKKWIAPNYRDGYRQGYLDGHSSQIQELKEQIKLLRWQLKGVRA